MSLRDLLAEQADNRKAIRELCRPYTDVDGDSDCVPSAVDVVENTIARLGAAVQRLRDELERLQAVVGEEDYELIEAVLKEQRDAKQ